MSLYLFPERIDWVSRLFDSRDMAPKRAKQTDTFVERSIFKPLLLRIGHLIVLLICNFYLLLVRYIGEGLHTLLQEMFGMIREVIKIILTLAARIISEICFGAALVIEKIVSAILHLFLLLIQGIGRFINQVAKGLVEQAGYGISSAIFIIVTLYFAWRIIPVLKQINHAISLYYSVTE